jgi:hypothetical protein
MRAALPETLKLAAAAYLLALAALACFGLHRGLLAYPAEVAYAVLRLFVLALTLGHVRLTPLAKRKYRSQRRRLRHLGERLGQWRQERAEERALAAGKSLALEPNEWHSTADAPPLRAPVPAEAAGPPEQPPPAKPSSGGGPLPPIFG